MIKLYDNGVYLLNGTEILEDTGNVSLPVSKEEAAKNTIAYGILDSHNTSGNMERLQIKFDKLTSQRYLRLWELFRRQELPDWKNFRYRMF